jgi:hypothetical protein
LRIHAGLRTDTLEKLRDSGRADYFAFSASLRENRVLGWGGLPSAFRGPVYPAFLAAVESFEPGKRPASPLVEASLCSLEIPLAGWLAWGVAGPWAGVAAAGLAALHPALSRPLPACRVEPVYGLLVLLLAVWLAEWGRKPGAARALGAGFILSVTLLCRSSLVLFPVVLLASLVLSREKSRTWQRSVWVLAGASFLFLFPWVLRNGLQFNRFIPLEDHAADRNFIAAVDGVIVNLEGPSPDGRREIPFDQLGERRLRALGKIAEDPLPYLASCIKRFGVMAGWHGPLLFLAGLGFLAFRRDPAILILGLLAATFFLTHAPLSLEARYVEPILPVLAVLGGVGGLEWVKSAGWMTGPFVEPPAKASAWIRWSVLGLGGVFYGFVLWRLAAEFF